MDELFTQRALTHCQTNPLPELTTLLRGEEDQHDE